MRRTLLIAITMLALLPAACGGSTAQGDDGAEGGGAAGDEAATGGAAGGDLSGDLTVFAAASLTDAFDELAEVFTAQHPDVQVIANYAGSQQLATQITEGAPADVFASASGGQMDVVVDAGLAEGDPQPFTGNLLEIAVEPGNPLGIEGLADLARDDLVLVLAAEEVPAGQYAAEALEKAGVQVSPASLENDVRAVLSKVELGEADAGVVYRSDVVAAGDAVEGVEIPEEANVRATYPIVTLVEAPNPEAARAFMELVMSDEGQAILTGYGFSTP